ncbi:MAG: aldose 1-epimerase family protein [bacterium]|nr:aldose 1-epimerase family protein [bacterium]
MKTVIKNSFLTATINSFGAELCSLKNNENKEYIWEGNPDFWGKHSPVLFPIVGTLKSNSYRYNETEYHLSRHGFAREMDFELVNQKENSVTFSIQSSEETLKVYPFIFELQITYTLDENSLSIEYNVINNGKSKMPFSIGAHPAFALAGNFENYAIQFEKEESLEYYLLENDLISNQTRTLESENKLVPLKYELFENDALIFKRLESNSVTILENKKPFLKVSFEDFPSLGIWTKINAPFLCIEPWFGYSDTNENSGNLFEKEGIQILEENKTFRSEFNIEIL